MLWFSSGAVPQETLKQRVCHLLPDSKRSCFYTNLLETKPKKQFWLPLRRTAEGVQGSWVGTVTGSFAREGTLHGAGTFPMHRRGGSTPRSSFVLTLRRDAIGRVRAPPPVHLWPHGKRQRRRRSTTPTRSTSWQHSVSLRPGWGRHSGRKIHHAHCRDGGWMEEVGLVQGWRGGRSVEALVLLRVVANLSPAWDLAFDFFVSLDLCD